MTVNGDEKDFHRKKHVIATLNTIPESHEYIPRKGCHENNLLQFDQAVARSTTDVDFSGLRITTVTALDCCTCTKEV